MPNGVDLAVHEAKMPALEAPLDCTLRKAKGDQLPLCDDPMLPFREGSDLPLPPNRTSLPAQGCLSSTTHTGG
jgi:hypothetical protein